MSEQTINSRQSLDAYIEHLKNQFDKHKYLRVAVKTGKQRSSTQNAALHLYCNHVAQALNDAGYDMRRTIKRDIDIPWTGEQVKNLIWRPIQKAVTGHDSTIKPERHQYGEIYEIINRNLSSKLGQFIPWPSKESKNG